MHQVKPLTAGGQTMMHKSECAPSSWKAASGRAVQLPVRSSQRGVELYLTTVLAHSTDTTEKELIAAIKLWPPRNCWVPINPGKWQPGVSDAVEWALTIQLQLIVESDWETLLHVGPLSQSRQTIPAAFILGAPLLFQWKRKHDSHSAGSARGNGRRAVHNTKRLIDLCWS